MTLNYLKCYHRLHSLSILTTSQIEQNKECIVVNEIVSRTALAQTVRDDNWQVKGLHGNVREDVKLENAAMVGAAQGRKTNSIFTTCANICNTPVIFCERVHRLQWRKLIIKFLVKCLGTDRKTQRKHSLVRNNAWTKITASPCFTSTDVLALHVFRALTMSLRQLYRILPVNELQPMSIGKWSAATTVNNINVILHC